MQHKQLCSTSPGAAGLVVISYWQDLSLNPFWDFPLPISSGQLEFLHLGGDDFHFCPLPLASCLAMGDGGIQPWVHLPNIKYSPIKFATKRRKPSDYVELPEGSNTPHYIIYN